MAGLGEVLWDIFGDVKTLGGAPANFAYHAGQVIGMDNTIVISALGTDPLAEETIKELKKHGLNSLLPQVPHPTGTVLVELDANSCPTYDIKENVAWDNIPFTEEIAGIAGNCRAVCFGSLAQRSTVSRTTIRKFLDAAPADCLKIFDINLRQHFYTTEIIEESLQRCNILKINDDELTLAGGMFGLPEELDREKKCRLILEKFRLEMLILTCDINGSYVFTPEDVSFQATPKVDAIDTVGAGESFTGSFIGCLLNGKSIHEAHCTAVRVSAFVCTQNGAMPAMPPSSCWF